MTNRSDPFFIPNVFKNYSLSLSLSLPLPRPRPAPPHPLPRRKAPKAVDKDLYRISPELLLAKHRRVDDDMQFLLENDAPKVEAVVKKHSDEVFTTLGHMEQQLEELLDTVLSNCRLMTLSEKQQLRKLIQKLPPRNLDRVVEIIQCNKPSGKYSADEIHVDLEKQDNVTLWRLYYYVKAVDNARELSG